MKGEFFDYYRGAFEHLPTIAFDCPISGQYQHHLKAKNLIHRGRGTLVVRTRTLCERCLQPKARRYEQNKAPNLQMNYTQLCDEDSDLRQFSS